ncbi:MAG: DUF4982 domain-containing protein [Bacteroidales bacterium]|nr:DUF4982 domain-containing protein [Bacteroidales bacterium]
MKTIVFLFISLLSGITINSHWTFQYFPSGDDSMIAPAATQYDDSRWPAIALPHTWMTFETTGDLHPFIRSAAERDDSYWWNGFGWYRKHIIIDKRNTGKKIFLEFDAVQKYCRLFVNGEYVGEHKGGYTSFCFDITPFVHLGSDNVIALQVSSRRDDKFGTIPPATAGNFNVYGGIYRDVRLRITDPVYIPFQGDYRQEGGTFITTPHVSATEGEVDIHTYVKNDGERDRLIVVGQAVVDEEGLTVQEMKDTVRIEAGQLLDVHQRSQSISGIHLWSPESPYLYHVVTTVSGNGGQVLDSLLSPLGFRWFWWDKEAGTLVLNGNLIHIHGTNRHQEFPWLGDAEPKWLMERDMLDIRYGMNTNFMRTAHYPQDPAVYDFNDRHGIITVEEVPNDKTIKFDRQTQENNMREMVRRDRNHPSIFFWSVGNETSCAADSRWTFEEDSTRIIHERKAEGYGEYVTHHASDLDMENLLRVTPRGWTDNDVRALEPSNEALGMKSGQMAGNEEWQHSMARVQDGSIRGRIDGNVVCWLYADHGCDRIYKDAPLRNINYKGWVDLYRIPKYMYYLWQANYLSEPMVYIHPHYWQEKYCGQKKTFRVDSNCDSVELFSNGKSLGVLYPGVENFHTVEFEDVLVEKGTLTAVAKKDGVVVRNSVEMASTPWKIILEVINDRIPADRSGVSLVIARVVDRSGRPVQGFSAPLTWSVSGQGRLIGAPVYESDIDKNLDSDGSGYVVAPVPNLVRSTAKAGRIRIKVSSPGLKTGKAVIRSCKSTPRYDGIVEPPLKDRGRERILRDSTFCETVEYVEEMARIYAPEQIRASSREEYKNAIKEFVLRHNTAMDKNTIEFKALVNRLTIYVENTRGELTEDDYNFVAQTYNSLRQITHTIRMTVPDPEERESLIESYSKRMLEDGEVIDVNAVLSQFNQKNDNNK